MICNLARRGGISGKIGDYVAQKTIPAAANCAAPGNPRQQVRRWIQTPRPNTIPQQWIARALRESWRFVNSNNTDRREEVLRATFSIGFYFNTLRLQPNGSYQSGFYKAPVKGSFIGSVIRETTRDVSNVYARPVSEADWFLRDLSDRGFIQQYLEDLAFFRYGFN